MDFPTHQKNQKAISAAVRANDPAAVVLAVGLSAHSLAELVQTVYADGPHGLTPELAGEMANEAELLDGTVQTCEAELRGCGLSEHQRTSMQWFCKTVGAFATFNKDIVLDMIRDVTERSVVNAIREVAEAPVQAA